MGNLWHKEKKKNEYIEQIKSIDVDNEELNSFITINNILIVKALKEVINEIEEMKDNENELVHFRLPKMDFCNFSVLWFIILITLIFLIYSNDCWCLLLLSCLALLHFLTSQPQLQV